MSATRMVYDVVDLRRVMIVGRYLRAVPAHALMDRLSAKHGAGRYVVRTVRIPVAVTP